jgi:beta-1,4-mannosyl-glycoprotein beta-1,4-N-acetylglucosaminyltransferase
MKKIIDCFTFYNEIDLLYYRLSILYDIVDYFVIVEAKQTHVGKDKILYFNENKDRYSKFLDKIIHIIVELPYKYPDIDIKLNQQWINENYQRDSISLGIDKINNLHNDDIIIISDLDEIPDKLTLSEILNHNLKNKVCYLEMVLHHYNLNIMAKHMWYHGKLLNYKTYKFFMKIGYTCDKIRMIHCDKTFDNCFIIKKGGWHLSSFGDINFIKNKLENFTHQESNIPEINNENYILKCFTDEQIIEKNNMKRSFNNDYLPYDYDKYFFNQLKQ